MAMLVVWRGTQIVAAASSPPLPRDDSRRQSDEPRSVMTNRSRAQSAAAYNARMSDRPSRLSCYLAHRRRNETVAWVSFLLLETTFNSIVAIMDAARSGLRIAPWEPMVWEFSSGLMLLALIPALLAFDRRVPLQWAQLPQRIGLHVLGSLVFSLTHIVGMEALRMLAYSLMGSRYTGFEHWPYVLVYEYLKDWRTYVLLLTLIYSYRLLLLRLQGEARLLAAPEEGAPEEPVERPERFLVRKLGKDFLVAARDIEWLEAAENYVNLHVRGHVYPLRSTMAAIEQRLDSTRFLRVHRRYIINLDQLAQIEPLDTGDARLLLKDGSKLPCSRTYRATLKTALTSPVGAAHGRD
jgi:hypothetical protein